MKKGIEVKIPPSLVNILRGASEEDRDAYCIKDIDGYETFQTCLVENEQKKNCANAFIDKCEQRAAHELKCYLMCVYSKLKTNP